jgi:mycothiol synthase
MVSPFTPSDLSGVLRLLSKAMPEDPISEARFTRQVLLDASFRPAGALVAREGEEVVGFCLSVARQVPLENAPSDAERGYVTLLAVDPEWRRRGIGTALLAGCEGYLQEQGRTLVMVSPYAPGYFIPGVDVSAYAGALAFFQARGYQEVYRPVAMEAPLWGWSPPDWLPATEATLAEAGVRFECFRSELALPLLEFALREFPGDWVRVVRETAARITQREPPDRLIAALEGEEVVGFVHHENERFGPIGVAKSQRGRGLGHALMFRCLEAIRGKGFRVAWFLWSDDTTAKRLYHAAGFREVRRFALLRKELR